MLGLSVQAKECSKLSEANCLISKECILKQQDHNNYYCDQVENDCERGFIQIGKKSINSCESKPGCHYLPPNCYCPPNQLCVCAGGKPSMCVNND